jgi:hypothetical protein
MSLGIEVSSRGPMFDGRAVKAGHESAEDSARAIAIEGSAMVRARQNVTFKTQTPYYRTHTQARKTMGGWRITGPAVAYGHWLEGTGSRNRTTRFKGYFIFRTMAAVLRMRAVAIASPVVARYVNSRMN